MIAPRTLEIGFEVIKNKFVKEAEAPQLRKDLPDFSPGDTVMVGIDNISMVNSV